MLIVSYRVCNLVINLLLLLFGSSFTSPYRDFNIIIELSNPIPIQTMRNYSLQSLLSPRIHSCSRMIITLKINFVASFLLPRHANPHAFNAQQANQHKFMQFMQTIIVIKRDSAQLIELNFNLAIQFVSVHSHSLPN